MLNNFPTSPEIKITSVGSGPLSELNVRFDISMPPVTVPNTCEQLLFQLGWTQRTCDPDTQESLYYKPSPDDATAEVRKGWDYDLQNGYWHWYEAMSYEFGKFMSIGDDSRG